MPGTPDAATEVAGKRSSASWTSTGASSVSAESGAAADGPRGADPGAATGATACVQQTANASAAVRQIRLDVTARTLSWQLGAV